MDAARGQKRRGRDSVSKTEWLALAGIALLGIFLRGHFLAQSEVVLPDEAFYISMGMALATGEAHGGLPPAPYERSASYSAGPPGLPLIPLVFRWACALGNDPVLACRWAGIAAWMFGLFFFYLCVRRFGGPVAGFWSSLLYALAPFSIEYSILAMNHSLFNLFFLAALYCLLRAQDGGKPLRFWAATGGAAVWGAYLCRVEAILLLAWWAAGTAFFAVLPSGRGTRRTSLAIVLTCSLAFLLLAIPVWIWIRSTSGAWGLDWYSNGGAAAKASQFAAKAFQGDASHMTLWNSLLQLHPLAAWGGYFLKNLAKEYLLLPQILPLGIWVLIAFGFAEMSAQKSSSARAWTTPALFGAFPLLFYPWLSLETRFLWPSMLVFLMASGPGILFLFRKAGTILETPLSSRWKISAGLCFLFLAVLQFLPGYYTMTMLFREEPLEQKQLGLWIRDHYAEPQALFTSDRRTAFYAGRSCDRLIRMHNIRNSAAGKTEFEKFLRSEKIDLVVADSRYIRKYYPRFEFLLEPQPMDCLEKVQEFTQEKERIALYRVTEPKA